MFRRGSSRFGGLSFANNNFEIASPDYDTYNENTALLHGKWQAAKAGIESTTDFINAQNVLGKDAAIKESTSAKFTDAIKPFVESGRYEDATMALDGAVREYRNNKGFATAVNNYNTYSAWAQEQRDSKGWSEDEHNGYIKALTDRYEGVKVHNDGTVTGSVSTRAMGDKVSIVDKLFNKIKDFDKTVSSEMARDIARQTVDGSTTAVARYEKEYTDPHALTAFIQREMDEDPEIRHYLETRRIIKGNMNPMALSNELDTSMGNSVINAQLLDKEFNSLISKDKNVTASRQKAFTDLYSLRNANGELTGKANPMLYNFRRQMVAAGMINTTDKTPTIDLYNSYKNSIGVYQNAVANGTSIEELRAASGRGEVIVEDPYVEGLQDKILLGARYAEIMPAIEEGIYKGDVAYQAYLPNSGTKSKYVKIFDYNNDFLKLAREQQEQAKEDSLPVLNLLTNSTMLRDNEVVSILEEDGVEGYTSMIAETAETLKNSANVVKDELNDLNRIINGVNLSSNIKDGDAGWIAPLKIEDIMTMDESELASFFNPKDTGEDSGHFTQEELSKLRTSDPATISTIKNAVEAYRKNKKQLNYQEDILDRARRYGELINPVSDEYVQDRVDQHITAIRELHKKSRSDGDPFASHGGETKFREKVKEEVINKYYNDLPATKEFIDNNYTNSTYTKRISLEGVENLNASNPAKQDMMLLKDAIKSDFTTKLADSNFKYKVSLSNGQVFEEHTGTKIDTKGWGSNHINLDKLKLTAFEQDDETLGMRYIFSAPVGSDLTGTIEINTDLMDDDYSQIYQHVFDLHSSGKVELNPKLAANMAYMSSTAGYVGKINYQDVNENLYNTGEHAVKFTFADGAGGKFDKTFGTIRRRFAHELSPEMVNHVKTYRDDYMNKYNIPTTDKASEVVELKYKDKVKNEETGEYETKTITKVFPDNASAYRYINAYYNLLSR